MKYFIAVDLFNYTVDLSTDLGLIVEHDLDGEDIKEIEEIHDEAERIEALAQLAEVDVAWDREEAKDIVVEELRRSDVDGCEEDIIHLAEMVKTIAENPGWDDTICRNY